MKKLISAFWEIFNHAVLKATLFLDILALFFALVNKPIFPSASYYFVLTTTAFMLSAGQLIASKNFEIKRLKTDRPVVSLSIKSISGEKRLRVRNLWNKPIKDISISKINAGIYKFIFSLEGPNALKDDEERSFVVDTQYGKGLNSLAMFESPYATTNFKTTVTYKDFKGNHYKMNFNLGKRGIFSTGDPELITAKRQ